MKKLPFLDFDVRYWRYFGQHRLLLIATFAAMLSSTLIGLVSPWPMKYIVDNVIGQQPFNDAFGRWLVQWIGTNRQTQVVVFGLLMLLLTGLSALFDFGETYLEGVVQARATFHLRSDLFAHIQALSLRFHDNMRTGETINRVSKDTERVINGLLSSMGDIITSVVKFVGLAATMLYLNWHLSLIAFAYIPFFLVAFTILRRRTKVFARTARQEEGLLFTVAHEILANVRIVRAFGRQTDEQRRFDQHGMALMAADLRAERWEAFVSVLVDLLKATAVVAIVWVGVTQIIANQLTVGELLIFLSYVGGFYGPLRKFSSITGTLQKAAVSGERVAELFDMPVPVNLPLVQAGQPLVVSSLGNGLSPHLAFPTYPMNGKSALVKRITGKVEFAQVNFSYDEGRNVLQNIAFTAYPGQKIGIVGATGAGKTTIMNLLMRFYDPTTGQILIDGLDLRTFPPAIWCRHVALVTQEPFLFAAPIRDNIAYGRPDAMLDDIVEAARIAHAHEFIMKLPNQYQSIIGERGATLSGGQRQRLTLARAVLCNTPILILDEPTSGLDTIAEQKVMKAIEEVSANRTTVISTHRLATIRNADLILVIEDGQIREQGQHDVLMLHGGKYAQLWAAQDELSPTIELSSKKKHG
ncbi:MAG: ABC transporter ATP-binding protein [Chloroflexi bacterium]|nr:ABC transporter ATP-binding protein [Chloroflexota bacterium]